MRSYRNKKDETIEVSTEHLETAVRIKQELQKASPSRRCSWKLHKELMIKEGFDDSDTCETYRCMVKDYQRQVGTLPSAPKHADMVASNKLESIKELVGEIAWQTRENQGVLRQLNRVKREVIDDGLFIEEVTSAINNVLSDVKWEEIRNQVFSPIKDHANTRMVAVVSDWHIGAIVDVEGNKYNWDIAQQRINEYVEKIIAIALEKKVYRIDVVYCGDILEHAYMRNSQAYHAEFPVAKQMALGGKLMIEMLLKLSKHFFTTYRGFAGNHDRLNGDKNGNIHGDTGMVVVNEIVETFIETAKIENLMFCECQPYSASLLNVNGRNFKFVHGDHEKKADTKKIANHGSNDKVLYDVIVYGHFHHYMFLEVGVDKFEVRCGSTKGSDDYSETLGLGSAPSQVAILVSEDGEIKGERIRLH